MPHATAVIRARLQALTNTKIAAHAKRFFKTGPGQYGEGDQFLGIRVPALRKLAREYRDTTEGDVFALLRSPLHEERLLALFLLIGRFERATPEERARIYARYVRAIKKCVNNWDLVDSSAREIVGGYLEDRDRRPLYELACSKNLWERRVAIIATFRFIKQGDFDDALAISTQLLGDEEDLIHKAVGWMLREIGNRDRAAAQRFLREHCRRMPRTMLRYAIEKFPERARRAYLAGIV